MSSELEFDRFVRTPFAVKATKITEENIEEVAKLVGDVRTKNDERYIALDRRIVPNVGRAFVGWWVTLLGDNLRCYSPKVFAEQFMEMPETQPVAFTFGEDEGAPVIVTEIRESQVSDTPHPGVIAGKRTEL